MKKILFAMLLAAWSGLCTAHTQGDEAAAAHSADQALSLKSIQFGPYKITALHDGDTALNPAVFDQNFSQQEVQAIFQGQSADPVKPVQTSVNAFLIEDDLGNLTLIDSGAGNCEGNHRGAAVQQIAAAGYKTSDVGTVLLTHLHPDHVCGIESQTKAVFPFATVYVSEKELSYWLSENTLAHLTADQQAQYTWTAAQIKAALAPYHQIRSVRTFKVGAVINGIEAVESAGHTPGHFLYQLQYQGRHLVFVGDIVHAANLQFFGSQK